MSANTGGFTIVIDITELDEARVPRDLLDAMVLQLAGYYGGTCARRRDRWLLRHCTTRDTTRLYQSMSQVLAKVIGVQAPGSRPFPLGGFVACLRFRSPFKGRALFWPALNAIFTVLEVGMYAEVVVGGFFLYINSKESVQFFTRLLSRLAQANWEAPESTGPSLLPGLQP